MTYAEFEEKEFENPLYHQLLAGSGLISTPGQVFENAFGYDAALEARHRIFWEMVDWPEVPRGVILNEFSWNYAWHRLGRQRRLPTFHINLLIQAKRPEFLKGRNSRFSGLGITGSYWRFRTRKHQQLLLEKLEQKLGGRALVVYASPAFHTYEKLDQYTTEGNMVEHSSFVTPERMKRHETWNYDRPGLDGVACSSPMGYIDWPDFYTELRNRIAEAEPQEGKAELKGLQRNLEEFVKEEEKNPIVQRFQRIDNAFRESAKERFSPELNFFRLSLFFKIAGVTWFVAGPEDVTTDEGE